MRKPSFGGQAEGGLVPWRSLICTQDKMGTRVRNEVVDPNRSTTWQANAISASARAQQSQKEAEKDCVHVVYFATRYKVHL